MPSASAFGFGLTVPIRGGLRVELSWWRLRQKLSKISYTYSSGPTALAWTDSSKDTPPTPALPSGNKDDIAHRVYDLPIHSRKALLDDYERDNGDDEKDEKVAQRILHSRSLLPPKSNIIFSGGITAYPSLPKRCFRTTINAMTTTKRRNICAKDTPSTPAPLSGEEDGIAQRDYKLPIPSVKAIPDDYERNDDNDTDDEKDVKFEGGDILVVAAG